MCAQYRALSWSEYWCGMENVRGRTEATVCGGTLHEVVAKRGGCMVSTREQSGRCGRQRGGHVSGLS
ncbi:hypothetical protein CSUI_004576 [Cystoisospora suis]|uniref:Uncharacterized protein n=1 Tax=Cystoisospora suis TaxID=483139 RepID=A0A2C6KWT2_9APIC|nr:hypothetical protein CSUI_004576 [Cystoisospora suis]